MSKKKGAFLHLAARSLSACLARGGPGFLFIRSSGYCWHSHSYCWFHYLRLHILAWVGHKQCLGRPREDANNDRMGLRKVPSNSLNPSERKSARTTGSSGFS